MSLIRFRRSKKEDHGSLEDEFWKHYIDDLKETVAGAKDISAKLASVATLRQAVGDAAMPTSMLMAALALPYSSKNLPKAYEFVRFFEMASHGDFTTNLRTMKLPSSQVIEHKGMENWGNVMCYLDALLVAMFAGLENFEPMLFVRNLLPADAVVKHLRDGENGDGSATTPPLLSNGLSPPLPEALAQQAKLVLRLAALLRVYVLMLRSGTLITLDITKRLAETLSALGYEEAMLHHQQDCAPLFQFLTDVMDMPMLSLKMDIQHGGKPNSLDDHRVTKERVIFVSVPDLEDEVLLEECLESYFSNLVEVRRELERRMSMDQRLSRQNLAMHPSSSLLMSPMLPEAKAGSWHREDTRRLMDTVSTEVPLLGLPPVNKVVTPITATAVDRLAPRSMWPMPRPESPAVELLPPLRSSLRPSLRPTSPSPGPLLEPFPETGTEEVAGKMDDIGQLPGEFPLNSSPQPVARASIDELVDPSSLFEPRLVYDPRALLSSDRSYFTRRLLDMTINPSIPPTDFPSIVDYPSLLLGRPPSVSKSSWNVRERLLSMWSINNKGGAAPREVLLPAWMFLQLLPFYTAVDSDNCVALLSLHFVLRRPILPICLKRYNYSSATGRIERLKTLVVIPPVIELPLFIAEDNDPYHPGSSSHGRFQLVLESMVCHRGTSITSGHFVAAVRKQIPLSEASECGENSEWLLYDDLATKKRVVTKTFKQILDTEWPYLLFYRMVEASSSEPPAPVETEVSNPPAYFPEPGSEPILLVGTNTLSTPLLPVQLALQAGAVPGLVLSAPLPQSSTTRHPSVATSDEMVRVRRKKLLLQMPRELQGATDIADRYYWYHRMPGTPEALRPGLVAGSLFGAQGLVSNLSDSLVVVNTLHGYALINYFKEEPPQWRINSSAVPLGLSDLGDLVGPTTLEPLELAVSPHLAPVAFAPQAELPADSKGKLWKRSRSLRRKGNEERRGVLPYESVSAGEELERPTSPTGRLARPLRKEKSSKARGEHLQTRHKSRRDKYTEEKCVVV